MTDAAKLPEEALSVEGVHFYNWCDGWMFLELHVRDGEGKERVVSLSMNTDEAVQTLQAMQFLVAQDLFGEGVSHMVAHVARTYGAPQRDQGKASK